MFFLIEKTNFFRLGLLVLEISFGIRSNLDAEMSSIWLDTKTSDNALRNEHLETCLYVKYSRITNDADSQSSIWKNVE